MEVPRIGQLKTNNTLGVLNLAAMNHSSDLLPGHLQRLQDLTGLKILRSPCQARSRVKMDDLVAKSGGGKDQTEFSESAGPITRFFLQLPSGTLDGALVFDELSGGDFIKKPSDGMPILFNQDHVTRVCKRDHRGSPGMFDDLQLNRVSVGKLNPLQIQSDHPAPVDGREVSA